MVVFSGIVYMFCAFVSWFYSIKFHLSHKKEGDLASRYSSLGMIFLGSAVFLYGIFSFIAPANSFFLEIGYVTGHTMLFIGFSLILKTMSVLLETIDYLKYAPFVSLFFGAIVLFVDLFYPASPWIDQYGLIHWNQYLVPRVAILSLDVIITAIIGILFVVNRPKHIKLQIRSVLVGIAFFIAGISGGMICFFNDVLMLFISYTLFGFGFLTAFIVPFIPSNTSGASTD